MSRPLRWIPEGGSLVEVTCRTVHGRLLLLPSEELNEIIIGILARAKQMYEVKICGFAFASNHYHLILRVEDAEQLSSFMCYLNSNLAREAGRLVDWGEKFWSRRYRSIVISEEEGAQVGRLKYVASHGAKEGLVDSPSEWPGVHCVHALLDGEPLKGYWFDRSQENVARTRREHFDRLRYATPESFELDPLPCWQGLTPEQIRARVSSLVNEIEIEAAAARQDMPSLGVEAVLAQDPHARPKQPEKSPAPRFHAWSHEARRVLYEAYSFFVGAFRDAAEKLRSGDRTARFPTGSFPPHLQFVRAG
ncbi:MAG TPA: transposase [Thermoanaerobaculia bacterium]|nr:transposase [Thermoanaerobaculia bacterium]